MSTPGEYAEQGLRTFEEARNKDQIYRSQREVRGLIRQNGLRKSTDAPEAFDTFPIASFKPTDPGGKIVEMKPTNPKDLIGSTKVPMGDVPAISEAYLALGHLEGTLKYGLVNWREAGVRASIYIQAMRRHIGKFKDGEWADPKTRVPHLASIMACCSILLDAKACGKLVDDRPKAVPNIGGQIDDLSQIVQHLYDLFADHHPKHHFIEEEAA